MFDVVVIGGGHAGCEAASAAARRGACVALVTFSFENLGQLSCNPSIGGVGKGHLVRELDVFDGLMAIGADRAAIHHRMLNRSKGSAVHGPRIQADRASYAQAIDQAVRRSGVTLVQGEAVALRLSGASIAGVELSDGQILPCRAVVIATGTFLGAEMFCGVERQSGGRNGEAAASRLADQIGALGLPILRLKTGTPPRLDGRRIDWARLAPQPSDREVWHMAALRPERRLPQLNCAITRTNSRTHEIIAHNFDRSPLFGGSIQGRGPRYCPSIEDKIKRFGERDGHQIFLEPEGLRSSLVYPNGLSTSLPLDVQQEMIRSVKGLESCPIVRPGYAVEYGCLEPRQLGVTLEHREIAGLFLAGQINGTTGYEEAAAQGLVAGLNAAAVANQLAPVSFERASSYIGVMIDDLTLHGVSEPYRMMTARAEFRLHLRADNAVTRLGQAAMDAQCVSQTRATSIRDHQASYAAAGARLDERVSEDQIAPGAGTDRRSWREWLQRADRKDAALALLPADPATAEAANDATYEPYLARQRSEWANLARDRQLKMPVTFDLSRVPGLSTEMIERLDAAQPETLDQASRVRGITPAALAALHFALARAAA